MDLKVEIRRVALVLTVGLAAACAPVGPDFVKPEAQSNDTWSDYVREEFRFEPQDRVDWWNIFNDPVLSQLVAAAHQNNNNIRPGPVRGR
jgi:outer membrane protein TolC